MKIIETALQVLNDEIDGINLLKKFFDSNFEDAVKTIFDSNGLGGFYCLTAEKL